MTDVTLTGQLYAGAEAPQVRAALPDHIRLSRAEPGCLRFDVTEGADGVFHVSEAFRDADAFDAHQTRTRASDWWRITGHLKRDFDVSGL